MPVIKHKSTCYKCLCVPAIGIKRVEHISSMSTVLTAAIYLAVELLCVSHLFGVSDGKTDRAVLWLWSFAYLISSDMTIVGLVQQRANEKLNVLKHFLSDQYTLLQMQSAIIIYHSWKVQ